MNKRINIIKKRFCLFVHVFMLSVVLGSCSADDIVQMKPSDTVMLSPNSVSLGIYGNVANSTRANYINGGYVLLQKGTIGVTRISGAIVQDNIPYSYGIPWRPIDEGMLLTSLSSNFAAYYPYDGRSNESGIYSGTGSNASLNLIPSVYAEEKDVCAGTFAATEVNRAPIVQLNHLYTRINVRFVKQFTFNGAGKITKFNITGHPSASYRLSDGIYTSAASIELPFTLDLTLGEAETSVDLLLVPIEDVSGGIPFSFTVDNVLYTGTIPASLFAESSSHMSAGWQYNLKVLLGDGGYTIQGDGSTAPEEGGWNVTTFKNYFEVEVDNSSLSTISLVDYGNDPNGFSYGGGNCWVLPVSTTVNMDYFFDATKEGQTNDNIGTTVATSNSTRGAKIVWMDNPNLITQVVFQNGLIKFTLPVNEVGNALIAVTDGEGTAGKILWSWHIWVVNNNSFMSLYSITGSFLDRNLGAMSASPGTDSYGLFYQWGRKDPILRDNLNTVAGPQTIDYSVQNPDVFITNSTSPYNWATEEVDFWGTSLYMNKYNPCPKGWTVMSPSDYSTFIPSNGGSWNDGYTWTYGGYFPAAGDKRFDNGALGSSGGFYWSNTQSTFGAAYRLYFVNGGYNTIGNNTTYGFSVRCVRE